MIDLHQDPLSLWLLECVVEHAIHLDTFDATPEEFERLTNLTTYVRSTHPDGLKERIVSLRSAGLLDIDDDGLYLTELGGRTWENYRQPDWERYFQMHEESLGTDEVRWVFSSISQCRIQEVVGFYLLVEQTAHALGDKPPIAVPMRPFHATYWKTFDMGWEITVLIERKPYWAACWTPQQVVDWTFLDWTSQKKLEKPRKT